PAAARSWRLPLVRCLPSGRWRDKTGAARRRRRPSFCWSASPNSTDERHRRGPGATSMQVTTQEKQQVPSEFDRVARTYDLLTGMNPGYLKHLRMSAERLALPARARVLDLCCGTGQSTEALRTVYPGA